MVEALPPNTVKIIKWLYKEPLFMSDLDARLKMSCNGRVNDLMHMRFVDVEREDFKDEDNTVNFRYYLTSQGEDYFCDYRAMKRAERRQFIAKWTLNIVVALLASLLGALLSRVSMKLWP